MKNKDNNKKNNYNPIQEKINSKSFLDNLILILGLILFVLVIIVIIYHFLKAKNPEAFMTEKELLLKTMQEYVDKEAAEKEANEEKNDGSFSVHFSDITVEGTLPKRMKDKFYIECFNDGLINIHSKYTYAISKTKLGYAKGIILKFRVIDKKDLEKVAIEEGEYKILGEYENYAIISIIPKDIEYLENDQTSVDNYKKLSEYRDEIINSIKINEIPIEMTIDGRES